MTTIPPAALQLPTTRRTRVPRHVRADPMGRPRRRRRRIPAAPSLRRVAVAAHRRPLGHLAVPPAWAPGRPPPDGTSIQLADLACSIGLGPATGPTSTVQRSLRRVVRFGLASWHGRLAVRTTVPPLSHRQLARLTADLQAAHRSLIAARPPARPARSTRSARQDVTPDSYDELWPPAGRSCPVTGCASSTPTAATRYTTAKASSSRPRPGPGRVTVTLPGTSPAPPPSTPTTSTARP